MCIVAYIDKVGKVTGSETMHYIHHIVHNDHVYRCTGVYWWLELCWPVAIVWKLYREIYWRSVRGVYTTWRRWSGAGANPGAPWRTTLQGLVAVCQDGDTRWVRAGEGCRGLVGRSQFRSVNCTSRSFFNVSSGLKLKRLARVYLYLVWESFILN